MRRVVVTGMAGITPLGGDWPQIRDAMELGQTGVRQMPDWDRLMDLNTRLAAPACWFAHENLYPRKKMRAMGRVAAMAVNTAETALFQAGLLDDPLLKSGRVGVAFGSSYGSTDPTRGFVHFMETGKSTDLSATSYIRMMSHTAAVNIAIFFGLAGRVIPTSSACTSGSQAIGYAYEAIGHGYADAMVAGGAEELCPTMVAVFDTLFATSCRNGEPNLTPRPYDRARDGLVIGEGAGTLVLEEREHALARGATIHAEIAGFGTNMDGVHITDPVSETMGAAMQLALNDAGIEAAEIAMVSGHGTATRQGDIAETLATQAILGADKPMHSLKSYFGHTLGACGALEAWLAIEMMRESRFVPTANLQDPDPACGVLDYIMGEARSIDAEFVMSNNFAFGGINTSLILARH
ncbi:beta-ketoacyl-ACP synthase [Emcibacter sp. SYSU 3D8]|uniref:beta-ketoacyl-ACP synthase n=1 Tax=Emcibacter sp. SYSU 3D8 TaxID=3133969 RepID=UPI0031FF476F